MSVLLFCNIGWMSRYEGLVGKPDKIVGGGAYVKAEEKGEEVCNFFACSDGYVYGHVETIHGERDRKIRMAYLGGDSDADKMEGVDVVWTATNPDGGGRKVVGWYRNATVFRDRQKFSCPPSKQHSRDEITSYRIRASAADAHRLELEQRSLSLDRGPGWMGHTQWWRPETTDPKIAQFARKVRSWIDGKQGPILSQREKTISASPSAAGSPYIRYIQAYEANISPMHDDLQKRFEAFLALTLAKDVKPNRASVDLRFRDPMRGLILAEIKPCTPNTARFAIRTAIGQLLDYRQKCDEKAKLLIVLGKRPDPVDQDLAISNDFGIAFPSGKTFEVLWPRRLPAN
jgi:hypothetical protein